MIEFKIKITEQLEGMHARGRKRILKQVNAEVARMWLNRFFDRHFHPTAYRRYGKVYTKRKTKRKNERPLFDTGEMMQRLKLSATVTSTSKKATLTMRGPWWVRAYKKAGLDKVAELTAVSRGEVRELARFIGRRIPVLMRRERGTRITRTR